MAGSRTLSPHPGPQPRREKQTLRLTRGCPVPAPDLLDCQLPWLPQHKLPCSRGRAGSAARPVAWQGWAQKGWAAGERQGPSPPCSPTHLADDHAPPLPIPGLGGQDGGPRVEGRGRPGKVVLHGSGCRAHHVSNIPTEAGRVAPGA